MRRPAAFGSHSNGKRGVLVEVGILVLLGAAAGCGGVCDGPSEYFRFERGDRCPFVLGEGRLELAPSTIALRPTPGGEQPSGDGGDTDGASDADTPTSAAEAPPGTTQDVRIRGSIGNGANGTPADGYEVWVELTECGSEEPCESNDGTASLLSASSPERSAILRPVEGGNCTIQTTTSAQCRLNPDGIAIVGVQSQQRETDGSEYCLCATSGEQLSGARVKVLYGFEEDETVRFRPIGFGTDCGAAEDDSCALESSRPGDAACSPSVLASCSDSARILSGTVRVEDASGSIVAKGLDIGATVSIQAGAGVGFADPRFGCEPSSLRVSRPIIVPSRSIESVPLDVCLAGDYDGDVTITTLVAGSSDPLGAPDTAVSTHFSVPPTVAGVFVDPVFEGGTEYDVFVASCDGTGVTGVEVVIEGTSAEIDRGNTDAQGKFRFSASEELFEVIVDEAGASCSYTF